MPPGRQPRIGEPPPLPRVGRCDPYRVTVGHWHRMTILSHHVFSIHLHYIPPTPPFTKGRTQPCTSKKDGECWCNHKKRGPGRWHGWLAVQVEGYPKPRLLGLTPAAARCDLRFSDAGYDLRGHVIEVKRLTEYFNGEMEARLLDRVENPGALMREPCMWAVVMRLYEAGDRDAGDNPFHKVGGISQVFRTGEKGQ